MMSQSPMDAPSIPTLKTASSQQVRSKFFNVIGIDSRKSPSEHAATPPKRQQPLAKEWMHPRQQQASRFEERLKYSAEEVQDVQDSPKRKLEEKSEDEKPKKRITFDTKVKVVPIPMRDEYSNRVRSRLWSNAIEIHENATRNSIEFAAEGWDWRSVMEDEYMFVDVTTGDLIHPVHYDIDKGET